MATPDNVLDQHDNSELLWPEAAAMTGQQTPDEFTSSPPQADSASLAVDRSPALRVRPYSLLDVPQLVRLPGLLRLDLPDSLVYPRAGLIDVSAALPILRRERPTFVATADGQQVGMVRFSPRRPDGRWVIQSIAASTGVYSPEPVWEALLAHGVRAAGLRGVRRLFARVPVGHPLISSMRQAGWVSYARETVFRAVSLAPKPRPARSIRLQEPADAWAIHQLYAAATPKQIQEIEALTSHVWHMEEARRSRRGVRRTGWLVEENGGRLAAFARLTKGSRASMVEVIVAPEQRAKLGALLDGVFQVPRQGRTRPVYAALREYQLDLRDFLLDLRFSEVGEQELLIRYTTATARTPAVDPVHFPVELRPAMPRRVPTFLEGQTTDGTA